MLTGGVASRCMHRSATLRRACWSPAAPRRLMEPADTCRPVAVAFVVAAPRTHWPRGAAAACRGSPAAAGFRHPFWSPLGPGADVLILPLFSSSAARFFFQQLGSLCACVFLLRCCCWPAAAAAVGALLRRGSLQENGNDRQVCPVSRLFRAQI